MSRGLGVFLAVALAAADAVGDSDIDRGSRTEACGVGVPSVHTLWPPNHKLVPVTIRGVRDPQGDPVTLTITAITQDEPLDGRGDGDTTPDALGVGTSTAMLRAERMGGGNGRVYEISYVTTDSGMVVCSGKVQVCVPKSQGKGAHCIDDGQSYDSTGRGNPPGRFRVAAGQLPSRPAPNPFNPSTIIQYTLPQTANVSLGIYNALGKRVRSFAIGVQAEGTHQAVWDGRDDENIELPSGVYTYRLASGGLVGTGRLVMIR